MKTVLITGTSRGIGAKLVKEFEKENTKVLALSRSYTKKSQQGNVTYISFDISKEKSIQRLVSFLKEQNIFLDIVINNAGKLVNASFERLSSYYLRQIFEVNVLGVFRLLQCLIPFFSEKVHVVNISSMGGIQGAMKFAGLSAYTSSKAVLISLTELLAEEYKDSQWHFNCLALGAVQTEMLLEAFPDYKAPINAEEMAKYIKDFALYQYPYFNGKILQVATTTP
ncbi:SDR family oxidoreductase [Capnocytophaga sp. G2]|uniref:SDR family NAD(P)-dependent oxidoreductase n=1 Tax=Capnocytophaga sp. G2 TaxID=3110695 RepID=UPI002B489FE0|nr:SDR family oxidoreductase [Capnocytophaga sp. G2]MEB3004462.1 SDR family oxidoreductase [Capnocytophaga sp. G2]